MRGPGVLDRLRGVAARERPASPSGTDDEIHLAVTDNLQLPFERHR
jgi:hypothetical protein